MSPKMSPFSEVAGKSRLLTFSVNVENFRTGIGAPVVKGPSFSPAPSQKSIKAAHYVFVPKRGLEEFRDWFCWFFPQLGKLSASVSRGKFFSDFI